MFEGAARLFIIIISNHQKFNFFVSFAAVGGAKFRDHLDVGVVEVVEVAPYIFRILYPNLLTEIFYKLIDMVIENLLRILLLIHFHLTIS